MATRQALYASRLNPETGLTNEQTAKRKKLLKKIQEGEGHTIRAETLAKYKLGKTFQDIVNDLESSKSRPSPQGDTRSVSASWITKVSKTLVSRLKKAGIEAAMTSLVSSVFTSGNTDTFIKYVQDQEFKPDTKVEYLKTVAFVMEKDPDNFLDHGSLKSEYEKIKKSIKQYQGEYKTEIEKHLAKPIYDWKFVSDKITEKFNGELPDLFFHTFEEMPVRSELGGMKYLEKPSDPKTNYFTKQGKTWIGHLGNYKTVSIYGIKDYKFSAKLSKMFDSFKFKNDQVIFPDDVWSKVKDWTTQAGIENYPMNEANATANQVMNGTRHIVATHFKNVKGFAERMLHSEGSHTQNYVHI